jgi:hypothetical protein
MATETAMPETPAPNAAPQSAAPEGSGGSEESTSTATTPVDDYAELSKVAKAAAAQFRADNPAPGDGEESEAPAPIANAGASGESGSTDDDDDTPLGRLLKSREKAQQKRGEADEYVTRMRSEAESVAQSIIRDAQERARRLEQETDQRIRARLDEHLSPEALLAKQADAQDPQVQLRRWVESELGKRDSELAKRDEVIKALHAAQEQQREAGDSIRLRQAEQAFVASAKKDTHPALLALFTPAEILSQGHALLAEAREEAKKQGVRDFTCTDAELLQTLERRAKQRLLESREALNSALQQVAATQGKASPGSKANAPRTLSALASSERRATPKPSADMNETDMDKAMRAAAKAALRSK